MDPSRNLSVADAEKIMGEIRDYISAVVEDIAPTKIDSVSATRIYRTHRDKRLFGHEFVVHLEDDEVLLIAESPRSRVEASPLGFIWFWNNHLWPMYPLTMWWRSADAEKKVSFRAFFKVGSSDLDLFRTKPTKIILLRGQKCISACVLNLQNVDPAMWDIFAKQVPREAVCDDLAAKVGVESNLNSSDNIAPVQQLEFSWAKRLDTEVATALRFFRNQENHQLIEEELERVQVSAFGEYFTANDNPAASIYNSIQKAYVSNQFNILKVLTLSHSELAQAVCHQDFVNSIMQCAWFSGHRTSCGKQIYSIGLNATTKAVSINIELLGHDLKHFWARIPFEWPFYFDEILGAGSCPIDIAELVKSTPVYEGEIAAGEEFVKDLFAEATSMKQWTIPFGAYVQLDVGSFRSVKLYEIGRDIACVFISNEGNYYEVWVNPSERKVSFTLEGQIAIEAGIAGKTMDWLARLRLGISILLAAIIRDFWVIEERETIFGIGTHGFCP